MTIVVLFTLRTVLFQPLQLLGPTTVGVVLVGVLWLAATASSGRGVTTRGRVQQALVLVGTSTALMVDPRAITALTETYEFGELYVARLMVVSVVAGLWEMWRFQLDPHHTARQSQAHLQGAAPQFTGVQFLGR
ncbi:MAG: hypothetical protein GXX86_12035 [Propionibacterium sp.]|nr:hypothetical protein [Propionibacterium sp.]